MGESNLLLSVAVLCLGVGGVVQAVVVWGLTNNLERRLRKLEERAAGEGERDVRPGA